MTSSLCDRPIEELARKIARREVSVAEVVDAHLSRAESLQGSLNAFVTIAADAARAAARAADDAVAAGSMRGVLHGIPFGAKDLIASRGIRTSMGAAAADWIPDEDATSIARMKSAGAILLGKTNLHMSATGIGRANPLGDVHNPWARDRIPGGSSSGSAVAVTTGAVCAALGTDDGGSVRIPAALSGCVGFKLTYGRVSLHGMGTFTPLVHLGTLARTVRDVALVSAAIAGYDPRDLLSADRPVPDWREEIEEGPRGLRIGVPEADYGEPTDAELADLARTALAVLEANGAVLQEVRWSRADEYLRQRRAMIRTEDVVAQSETLMALGRTRSGEADEALEGVDVLAIPTVRPRAWTIKEAKEKSPTAFSELTGRCNATGQPAITIPCGFTSDTMPAGITFIARRWDEGMALRAARAYEVLRGPWPAPPI